MFPYKTVEQAEHIETPLSTDMKNAIDLWHDIYVNKAPWLNEDCVSLNLGALISSEIARQVLIEFKWNVTSPKKDDIENTNSEINEAETQQIVRDEPDNERVMFLKNSVSLISENLMRRLEPGLASGSMIIKPYVRHGRVYFDYAMGWDIYPIAFDDDGSLIDVIFCDQFNDGDKVYTRLERHTRNLEENSLSITNRCFVNDTKDTFGSKASDLGEEVPLTDVPQWSDLESEVVIENVDGMLFGFFKSATANNVDVNGPMGISVYSKATGTIKQADIQYSRMLWEYEGTELAVHVDMNALKVMENGDKDTAHLRDRLYRKVDFGEDNTYEVFSPAIRHEAYKNGLNILLEKIEDQCGISRGTLSDANTDARTATELKILKERTYTTIHSNQMALERCLKDVLKAVDTYATIYDLAPDGEYDTSFEWDDSIITDTTQQLNERMELFSNNILSRVEMRQWYLGETEAQAIAAIKKIDDDGSNKEMDLDALSMDMANIAENTTKMPLEPREGQEDNGDKQKNEKP